MVGARAANAAAKRDRHGARESRAGRPGGCHWASHHQTGAPDIWGVKGGEHCWSWGAAGPPRRRCSPLGGHSLHKGPGAEQETGGRSLCGPWPGLSPMRRQGLSLAGREERLPGRGESCPGLVVLTRGTENVNESARLRAGPPGDREPRRGEARQQSSAKAQRCGQREAYPQPPSPTHRPEGQAPLIPAAPAATCGPCKASGRRQGSGSQELPLSRLQPRSSSTAP